MTVDFCPSIREMGLSEAFLLNAHYADQIGCLGGTSHLSPDIQILLSQNISAKTFPISTEESDRRIHQAHLFAGALKKIPSLSDPCREETAHFLRTLGELQWQEARGLDATKRQFVYLSQGVSECDAVIQAVTGGSMLPTLSRAFHKELKKRRVDIPARTELVQTLVLQVEDLFKQAHGIDGRNETAMIEFPEEPPSAQEAPKLRPLPLCQIVKPLHVKLQNFELLRYWNLLAVRCNNLALEKLRPLLSEGSASDLERLDLLVARVQTDTKALDLEIQNEITKLKEAILSSKPLNEKCWGDLNHFIDQFNNAAGYDPRGLQFLVWDLKKKRRAIQDCARILPGSIVIEGLNKSLEAPTERLAEMQRISEQPLVETKKDRDPGTHLKKLVEKTRKPERKYHVVEKKFPYSMMTIAITGIVFVAGAIFIAMNQELQERIV